MRYQNDNPPFLASRAAARPSVRPFGGVFMQLRRGWSAAFADGPWLSIAAAAGLLLLALRSIQGA